MEDRDTLQRFLFEHSSIRGELVHLDESFQTILERGDYPPPVRQLLGEALAAVMLLGATIKFDGSLILQVQGEGPVNLLVVQATSQGTFRGLARWEGEVATGSLAQMFGKGQLAITIDPGPGMERYQGIVALGGQSLSEALEQYFTQSEQLETRLWLAADEHSAAGLLLQQLPDDPEEGDRWTRVTTLGATIRDEELLRLPNQEILRRLFHEEEVRLYEGEPVSFRCGCSPERIEALVRGLGIEEARSIIEDEGAITAVCEFCNQIYSLDAVDVEALFANPGTSSSSSSAIH